MAHVVCMCLRLVSLMSDQKILLKILFHLSLEYKIVFIRNVFGQNVRFQLFITGLTLLQCTMHYYYLILLVSHFHM